MYTVQFPKLGWEFHVDPTAFYIGDTPIAWYGIIIAVGFMLAFLYAMFSCKKMNINSDKLGQLRVGRHGHRHHRGTAVLCVVLSR